MISKAQAKYVQSLHQKKYRQRHGAFLVEGGKSVLELLSSGVATESVWCTPEFADQNRAKLAAGPPPGLLSEAELAQVSTLATNTTALAVARRPPEAPLSPALALGALVLALDEVRDPGNLGTLIRLADWYGLPGLVLSDTCADPWAPKTVAATMGSFARVSIWPRPLAEWLGALPAGTAVYGADLRGDNVHRAALAPAGQRLRQLVPAAPVAWQSMFSPADTAKRLAKVPLPPLPPLAPAEPALPPLPPARR
ncbi:TrmH family RNA methyltransferase [Hymenobacter coccineus]|uniref:RNA methyltransferase n=1 Tax=Hymenobacter coccineus TaxID=1908235 RepID=A0A1G1TGJ6_9BACT|nr:TrmH family RNA methyltransferase [Hymenobacter coccineus]OGX89997.1 RNA methyltransferase [Hymenobacter coccineus]